MNKVMINSEYKIVLPVKFSPLCEKMIHAMHTFNNLDRSEIHLIVVCQNKEDETTELNKLKDWAGNFKFKLVTVVKAGSVASEVVKYSESIKASAIVIMKEPEFGSYVEFIGEISKEMIALSDIPVMVFKNNVDLSEIKTILVPLDVNQENKKKISNAMFYSQFFNGAFIQFMSVVIDANDYILNRNIFQLQHLVHFVEKAGYDCAGEIMRCISEEGDSISKGVVDYARRSEADIVLIVTDDEKSTKKNFISELTGQMLANLPNNLIVLNP